MDGNLRVVEGGKELLGQIEGLWVQLNNHHMSNSGHFMERYQNFTFENRLKSLQTKAGSGEILVLLIKDLGLEQYVGYCVSTVDESAEGEIESIFVMESHRKLGLGDYLMERSIGWLEQKGAKDIVLKVAGGNERVLAFYKKYGFYTTSIKLARAVQGEPRDKKNDGGYKISSDKSLIDLDVVEAMLNKSYWAAGRSRERIKTSIENSMCFGVYDGERQIAFARVITDYAVFAYLCDVIVDEEYRGKGIAKKLMDYIIGCSELKEVRSWTLKTKDAHGLYQQYGFEKPSNPDLYMQRILK